MVISWFFNSISKHILPTILYYDFVHEIWFDLKDRFQQHNDPQLFKLKKQMTDLSQSQLSINQYFTQLKALCEGMM